MNRVEKNIYILIWMIFLFLFRSRRKSDRVWGGPVGTYPAAGYGVWSGWLQQVVGVAAPSGGQRLPSDSTRRPSTHPPSCGGSREFLEREGGRGFPNMNFISLSLSRERSVRSQSRRWSCALKTNNLEFLFRNSPRICLWVRFLRREYELLHLDCYYYSEKYFVTQQRVSICIPPLSPSNEHPPFVRGEFGIRKGEERGAQPRGVEQARG